MKTSEMGPTLEVPAWSGKGEVYSWTVVTREAAGDRFVEFTPYAVAIIKLDEGPLVTAMLTDVDNNKIFIGMRVEMVTRKLCQLGDAGLIIYGYKFRPILPESGKTLLETIEEIMAEGN